MATEVMNRIEKKYTIGAEAYSRILRELERHVELDEYNRKADFYTISNLYYDTPDSDLIRLSLAKPEYKEKIRLRAYGVPGAGDRVWLEVKKKYRKVVNKRRAGLQLGDAYEFLETGAPPLGVPETQITRELAFALKRYAPVPKVYIAYDRRAYFGDDGLRITFDSNIRTRRQDLRLESGSHGSLLLPGGLWLMEIKAEGGFPLWLTALLSENRVFSSSFSKYGKEYVEFLAKGGERKCSSQYSQTRLTQPLATSAGKGSAPLSA